MPNLEVKQQVVQDLTQKIKRSKSMVLADYRGIKVSEETKLRKELREAGVEYKVVKNTMTTFAVRQAGLSDLESYLKGPTAIAFGYEEPVLPAKILVNFAKNNEKFQIKAGVVEGKVIDMDGVKALAELPSREVLLSKLAYLFNAPITNWVNVLQAPIRNLAYALDAVRKQKEEDV